MSKSIKLTPVERENLALTALVMSDENIMAFCSEGDNKSYCNATPLIAERVDSIKLKSVTGKSPHSKAESVKMLKTFKPEELVEYVAPLDDEGFKEFFSTSPTAKDVVKSNSFLSIRAESLGLVKSQLPALSNLDLAGELEKDAERLSPYSISDLKELAETDEWVDEVISSPQFARARSDVIASERQSRSVSNSYSSQARPSRSPVRKSTPVSARPVFASARQSIKQSAVRSPSPIAVRSVSPQRSLVASRSPIASPKRSLSQVTSRSPSPVQRSPARLSTLSGSKTLNAGEVVTNSLGQEFIANGFEVPVSRVASAHVGSLPRSQKHVVTDESSSDEEVVYAACKLKHKGKPIVHWR